MRPRESVRGHSGHSAGSKSGESLQQFGHQWCGVFVTIGPGAQDHDGKGNSSEILLVRQVFIQAHKHIETSGGGDLGEQAAVFDSRPALPLHSGYLVPRKMATQTTWQTFVEQKPHDSESGHRHADQKLAAAFEESHDLFAAHGGKVFEEIRKTVPTFQVIEQVAHGHARAGETGRAAHKLRINDHDFI